MITETGKIVAIDEGALWVETIQSSTCQSCAAEKGCGQSLMAKWGGHSSYLRVLLDGRRSENFSLHDDVTIGVPEDVVANGSLFVYLLPLITMVMATLIADKLGLTEGAVILSALIGLLVGGGVVRWRSYLGRTDTRLQPVIIDGAIDKTRPLQWAN
jgi:sigma-E factor negative regulatory protein RseC